jgi:hypothetical protein
MSRRPDEHHRPGHNATQPVEPLNYPLPGGPEDGEDIEVRAHRGRRRASIYREQLVSERMWDDLAALARANQGEAFLDVDPWDDELDPGRADRVAASLEDLRPLATGELVAAIDGLVAVLRFCAESREEPSWVRVLGP